MDVSEAKEILKDNYLKLGLQLIDEHQHENSLYFKYLSGRVILRLAEEEIRDFASSEAFRLELRKLPVECSICSSSYREQMVDYSYDRNRRIFLGRDMTFVFGEPNDQSPYAEVGPATHLFFDFFRFDETYTQIALERIRRGPPTYREEPQSLRDFLFKPLTIRVYNLRESSLEAGLKKSSAIIDACIFELAYIKGVPLTLVEEWPRRQPRVRPFQFGEPIAGNNLPLPRINFNSDTVRFYQRGMSTDDPVNQFLSFYQVLEYHFVTVADEQLYGKLSRRINDPKFSATAAHLDRLIQDTLEHKRETDETEMLRLVLGKFVDEPELIDFVKAYEIYLDDNLFTKKREIFGVEIEIRLNPGHVIGNVAKRVKAIRNALVHSSDRHERKQRYIPSASSENMIRREIPLMKFLAERVIVSSAR